MMENLPTVFQIQDGTIAFEELGKPNGIIRWDEDSVMNSLGYETQSAYRDTIMRAMQACITLKIDPAEDFTRVDGKYKLTRFACYLIAMNGDNKKPQVAAAQAYFATLASTFKNETLHAEAMDRVQIREETKKGNMVLNSVAKAHGVIRYDLMLDKGYKGMYNMSLPELCKFKGISDPKKFWDEIGARELAANLFRIKETEAKIVKTNIQGQQQLEGAAYSVGKQVRQIMQDNEGTNPEMLERAAPLNEVKKQIKDTNKKFKQIDSNKDKPSTD